MAVQNGPENRMTVGMLDRHSRPAGAEARVLSGLIGTAEEAAERAVVEEKSSSQALKRGHISTT